MSRSLSRHWASLAVLVGLGAPVPLNAQPPDSLSFFALTPCRVFDTRLGDQGGVLATNTPEPSPPAPPTASSVTRGYKIRGQCQIPGNAQAIAYNVTVPGQGFVGHLTLYPGGASTPTASSLNFAANQTTSNGGVVQLGSSQTGELMAKLFLGGAPLGSQVHLVLDVNGYFAP